VPRLLTAVALALLLGACSTPHKATSPRVSASATPIATAVPTPSETANPESLCDGNTLEMAQCLQAVLAQLEHRMQRTYDDTRRALAAAKRDGDFTVEPLDGHRVTVDPSAELRGAQYAFLDYRKKMCGAEYDAYIQGSIRVLVVVQCEINLTRRQIAEITSMTGPG
jgi:uncharacterized protein YecT (DUF1311 family)